MIPVIDYASKITIPNVSEVWLEATGNSVKLFSNAIKTPDITIYPNISLLNDQWIYVNHNKVLELSDGKESVLLELDKSVSGVVYIDGELVQVKKGLFGILFQNEKYLSFERKYNFSVLLNSKEIKIITPYYNKIIELEKPKYYRIYRNFMDLVYDNEVKVIYADGNVKKFSKEGFYIGTSSLGNLFQTPSGRIISDSSQYDVLGICSSEAEFLGESFGGILILCENRAKIFYKGGWSYIGLVSNPFATVANGEFIIITDSISHIFHYTLKKLFDLKNTRSLSILGRNLVILTNSGKVYYVSIGDESEYYKIKKFEGYSIIYLSEKISGEIVLGRKLVEVKRWFDNGKLAIKIEPFNLSDSYKDKIVVTNEIFDYNFDVEVSGGNINLELSSGVVKVLRNGMYKGDKNSNAVLELHLNYKFPTELEKKVKVRVGNKELEQEVGKEGSLSLKLPYYKNNNNEEENVIVELIRGAKIELKKEFIVRVLEVKIDSNNYREVQGIEDYKEYKMKVYSNGEFESYELFEKPSFYDNLIMSKVGETVNVDGIKINVKEGLNSVIVKKENEKRTYYIYGVSEPLRGVKVYLKGDELVIHLDKAYPQFPLTIVYGTNYITTLSDTVIFKADPAYSFIHVLAKIGELRWEYNYKIDLLLPVIRNASMIGSKVKELFESFGVL